MVKLSEWNSAFFDEFSSDGSLRGTHGSPTARTGGTEPGTPTSPGVLHVDVGPYNLQVIGRSDGLHEGCENPVRLSALPFFHGVFIDRSNRPLAAGDSLLKVMRNDTHKSSRVLVGENGEVAERYLFEKDGDRHHTWRGDVAENGEELQLNFGQYRSRLRAPQQVDLAMC